MRARLVSSIAAVLFLLAEVSSMASSSISSSSSSPSGFHRLRQRMHRRRHKQKIPVDQLEELMEMTAAQEEVIHRAVKNTARRERNEDLCASNRRSVELNSEQWEFDPPFLVEIRCRNVHDYEVGAKGTIEDQKCVHGLLRCVQRYAEVMTVRRAVDSSQWHPHLIRSVPSGCDCMWPLDKYGHQDL